MLQVEGFWVVITTGFPPARVGSRRLGFRRPDIHPFHKVIFFSLAVNKNLKAKAHKDKGNVGVSALTTLGDYEKGGLFSEGKLY